MDIGEYFSGFGISASGLSAQRQRMNAVAKNIANLDTTRTEEGGPYRREMIVLEEMSSRKGPGGAMNPRRLQLHRTHRGHMSIRTRPSSKRASVGNGVQVAGTFRDKTLSKRVFDPTHPDADADGYVTFPNVSVVSEMVDMMSASRAYEANVTALNSAKNMIKKALEI